MIQHFVDLIQAWLTQSGFNGDLEKVIEFSVIVLILVAISVLSDLVAKRILLSSVEKILKKTTNTWDDVLIEKKVFDSLSHIVPAIALMFLIPSMLINFPSWVDFLIKSTEIYIIGVVVLVFISFFNAIEYYFKNSDTFKDKPVESYFQLIKIIAYALGGIFILSVSLNKSPLYFLSAFGAISAVVLLIFKDTILGFVASIQLAANDMVRVGDWVQMDKFGADGNVIKITLNTIKVCNFDNTITTIPTYAFVSDSFKNWRGMQESGGRRIKRAVLIDIDSIRYCTPESLAKYEQYQLISTYLMQKSEEIKSFNSLNKVNKQNDINGRHLTNIGIYRNYILAYIKAHPDINENMTLMVRQLAPSNLGVSLEVYCFTKTIEWVEYERIQSDIFDHVLSAMKDFDLIPYQSMHGKLN